MTRKVDATVMAVVMDIVSAELRVARDKVTPDTDLARDLEADSLDALNIAVRLEKVFNIKIPDVVLAEFRTVAAIAEQIAGMTHGVQFRAADRGTER